MPCFNQRCCTKCCLQSMCCTLCTATRHDINGSLKGAGSWGSVCFIEPFYVPIQFWTTATSSRMDVRHHVWCMWCMSPGQYHVFCQAGTSLPLWSSCTPPFCLFFFISEKKLRSDCACGWGGKHEGITRRETIPLVKTLYCLQLGRYCSL